MTDQHNIFNLLNRKIQSLKTSHLYRKPDISDNYKSVYIKRGNKKYICFCSNDYLGLNNNKQVKTAAIKAIKKYGFGAGASRYITGNNHLYQILEQKLSKLKNSDDSIVFGSGYLTAIGVIPALMGNKDLIIADKLIHSCLIDGAKLSGTKFLRFKHNDLEHCQKLLDKNRDKYQKCLIITETVFSMDGDLGEINQLLNLAVKYNCLLLSDDAHGIGIINQKQLYKQLNESKNKDKKNIYLQIGTLSKAVGGYGGYICANQLVIDYLRNFARTAIYSTALPPAIIAGNLQALKIIEKDQKLKEKALENAAYFCHAMNPPPPQSTIVIIIVTQAEKALQIVTKRTSRLTVGEF